MTKALLGLAAAVLIAIAAARVAYTISTDTGDDVAAEAWSQNQMEFVAWNDDRWTAWIHDGAFEQVPESGRRHRHANPSIAFVDWHGEAWQAKIDGDEFLLAHRGEWDGSIQRSDAIRYRDWSGNNQIRTVAQLER